MMSKTLPFKIINYSKANSSIDFGRKIIFFLLSATKFHLIRKLRALFYFKTIHIKMCSGVLLKGIINDISIGKDNYIYDNCIFYLRPDAQFTTGARVTFSHNVLISCNKRINIGNDVMIGEFTSIRDSTHDYKSEIMQSGNDIFKEIIIGNNVWIGRGCLIQEGTHIEDGVVVAANSVVKGKLEANSIYGGTPAKFIKMRV